MKIYKMYYDIINNSIKKCQAHLQIQCTDEAKVPGHSLRAFNMNGKIPLQKDIYLVNFRLALLFLDSVNILQFTNYEEGNYKKK